MHCFCSFLLKLLYLFYYTDMSIDKTFFFYSDISARPGTGDKLIILQTDEENEEKNVSVSGPHFLLHLSVLLFICVIRLVLIYHLYSAKEIWYEQIIHHNYRGKVREEACLKDWRLVGYESDFFRG